MAAEYATPAQIARMLWPDSDGWKRASNRGSTPAGGAMGATMPMKAAVVLRRLRELRCAEIHPVGRNRWAITQAGRSALTDERRLPAFVIGRDGTFEYWGRRHLLSRVDGGYVVAELTDTAATVTFTLAEPDVVFATRSDVKAVLRRALGAEAPQLNAWLRQHASDPA